MADQPHLIYLEPDDEITSVVRRLRAAESGSVVIVAPGRSRATSSAVALRLLAQVAAEEARTVSLVADAPTRAVAAEAGIAAFASVAEATSGAVPDIAAATPRAPIRVVRGASEGVAASTGLAAAPRSRRGDETMPVRLPPRPRRGGGSSPAKGRLAAVPRWPWLVGILAIAVIAGAALLPGATVRITAATSAIGPEIYQVHLPIAGHRSDELRSTHSGTPTGNRPELVAAIGTVTFFNWSGVTVEVPKGTPVSVSGTIVFTTVERIVVPKGHFQPQAPGQKQVGVVAKDAGLTGNVAAEAINRVEDASVNFYLRGGFADNTNRLVMNFEPTSGGLETPHTVLQQSDVDAVVAAIQTDLASQLAAALGGQADRLYAGPAASEAPQIEVPPTLVGTEDLATFELSGTLTFDRPYVLKADLGAAARSALQRDTGAAPEGTTVLPDSIEVEAGAATVNGNEVTVPVTVRAKAAAAIDEAAVRAKIAGKTVAEARAALEGDGKVTIDLWPDWLDRLPRIPFRITVETVAPANGASPSP